MVAAAEFRIDQSTHDVLTNSTPSSPTPAKAKGLPLPELFFPQVPGRMNDPGWETPPEKRNYGAEDVHLSLQKWFFAFAAREFSPRGSTTIAVTVNSIDKPWLRHWNLRGDDGPGQPEESRCSRAHYLQRRSLSASLVPKSAPHIIMNFGVWFEGQFGNGHAFGSTTDSGMYQVEARYGRLVFTNRLIALRYVADVVPLSVVADPRANGQRAYAYGTGGSPIGAQVNFLHSRRVQPFLTSGGGSSISTGGCSAPLSSTSPPNLGQACKCSPPGTTASTLATSIITFPMPI
jgi:hypothetical protein